MGFGNLWGTSLRSVLEWYQQHRPRKEPTMLDPNLCNKVSQDDKGYHFCTAPIAHDGQCVPSNKVVK